MASPVDAGRATTVVSTAADPWTVNLPAGIQAGDLLVLYARTGGAQTFNLPAGWYGFLIQNDASDASDDVFSIIVKTATGSEGSALSLDLSAAAKGVAVVWRITGAPALGSGTVVDIASAFFTTAANAANPPSKSPTGGSKDYLFLAIASLGGLGPFTAGPSGYANFVTAASSGSTANSNAAVAGASKAATTATEDAGAFTHTASATGGVASVVVIYPSAVDITVTATAAGLILGGVPAVSAGFTPPACPKDPICGTHLCGEAICGAWFACVSSPALLLGGQPPVVITANADEVPQAGLLLGAWVPVDVGQIYLVPQAGLKLGAEVPSVTIGMTLVAPQAGLVLGAVIPALVISTTLAVTPAGLLLGTFPATFVGQILLLPTSCVDVTLSPSVEEDLVLVGEVCTDLILLPAKGQ